MEKNLEFPKDIIMENYIKMMLTYKHLLLCKIAVNIIQYPRANLKNTLLMTLYLIGYKFTNLWILQKDLQTTSISHIQDFSINKTFTLASRKYTKMEITMSMLASTQTTKTTIKSIKYLKIKKGISKMWESIQRKVKTITTASELITRQAISLKCTITLFNLKTRKKGSI